MRRDGASLSNDAGASCDRAPHPRTLDGRTFDVDDASWRFVMLDALTTAWSRPYKIVRVLQALGMDVPQRLRRERLALVLEALKRNEIEAVLADYAPIDSDDSPGIDAKIRLRRLDAQPPIRTVLGYEVVAKR
jgi:hypothetical protein